MKRFLTSACLSVVALSTLASAQSPFCIADGTGGLIDCPCGNNSVLPGRGCDNSFFPKGGADLTVSGTTTPDTLVLTTSGENPTALSIFLQGTAIIPNGVVFGDGIRCTGGVLTRLYTKFAFAGSATAPSAGDPSITLHSLKLGDPILPGTTRYYQVFYRDTSLTFCPRPLGNTFNISSGQIVLW